MNDRFKNGVFSITEENQCPLYNIGEEFNVQDGILSLPAAKPTCLTLAQGFLTVITTPDRQGRRSRPGTDGKMTFECGGCVGKIRLAFKKEKGHATLQMQMLAAAEKKNNLQNSSVHVGALRKIEVFKPLSDEDLLDLSALVKIREYPKRFLIIQKGDPEAKFCVIFSGSVIVVSKEQGRILATLHAGDVFGELSLLSGEPATHTMMAAGPCKIAEMGQKNFHHMLHRFPDLRTSLGKLMVSRVTAMNEQRAEELSSAMVGQLSEIGVIELFQMINSSQKTGTLQVDIRDRRAITLFNEGELVHSQFDGLEGKEAFHAIMAMVNGRFKFTLDLTAAEKQLDVIGGFESLLFEGLQMMDENGG